MHTASGNCLGIRGLLTGPVRDHFDRYRPVHVQRLASSLDDGCRHDD